MKVCHLTSVHPAIDTRILYKECSSLAKKYEVYLIGKHHKKESINRVHIIPFPKFRNRFVRILVSPIFMFFYALKIKANVYHTHDPELIFTLFLLKLFSNAKLIYDIHEHVKGLMYSKEYLNLHLIKIVNKVYELFEEIILPSFNLLIASTKNIEKEIKIFNLNCETINNFPLLEEFNPISNWNEKDNSICYIGSITKDRGINQIIKLLESVNVTLNLGGSYEPPSLVDTLKCGKGWKRVKEYGFVNREKVSQIMSKSLVGMMILHPTKNYFNSFPNKMFEYMAASIPIVASKFPLWEKIIQESNCGICVDPLKLKEIVYATEYLINNPDVAQRMGQNGRKAVEEKYNWGIEEKKLFAVYQEVLGES
ncbi:MAG: glycosyltransferase family 4 protein [Candidatus Cloacimonetes bacterium]|nr:glycosyltransferase family 4 protein [Candidatus Cloacimonadota bacterium]